MKTVSVLIVCTGNICRSPIAALVFAEHLRRAGLSDRVVVSSAGLGPWHAGDPADPRAARVLARHGYPTDHVAAQVNEHHLEADLLVAMDSGHERALRDLLRHTGESAQRIRMFRSFDPAVGTDLDVPDPYYGGPEGFVTVLAQVEAAMPGLLDWARLHTEP